MVIIEQLNHLARLKGSCFHKLETRMGKEQRKWKTWPRQPKDNKSLL
jgi:hypothetical protein